MTDPSAPSCNEAVASERAAVVALLRLRAAQCKVWHSYVGAIVDGVADEIVCGKHIANRESSDDTSKPEGQAP